MGFGSFFKKVLDPFGTMTGDEDAPPPPTVDPRIAQNEAKLTKQATDFRASMPQKQQQYGKMAEDQSRQALAQQMHQIGQSANQRGLLYSGIKTGAESGAAAQNSGELANKKSQINQELEGQAQELENRAITGAMNAEKSQQETYNQAYQSALGRKSLGGKVMGNVAGGIGSALGLL